MSLSGYAKRSDVLVLALPRGGVPVAFEVAQALYAPLDVFIVRKLGVPGHEEYAMGAIASGGIRVLNTNVIHMMGISESALESVTAAEQIELARREELYRGDLPPPVVTSDIVPARCSSFHSVLPLTVEMAWMLPMFCTVGTGWPVLRVP